jgi:hypothetical protein
LNEKSLDVKMDQESRRRRESFFLSREKSESAVTSAARWRTARGSKAVGVWELVLGAGPEFGTTVG